MQKTFEYIGLISLMCFSFFITEKTNTIVKNMDNIMLEIKNNYKKYEVEYKNALIENDVIKPGICSKKVNINKSYNEMKKVGLYDDKLYQYEYDLPKINILNSYDKYVVSGNEYKNYVYIFVNLNNSNKDLLSKHDFENYNFIVTASFYNKNTKLIKELVDNGNSILISSTKFRKYKKISKNYYDKYGKKIYCYNENKDDNFLDTCSGNKSNSIYVEDINLYDLSDIKTKIKIGNFIGIKLNKSLLNNIEILEKYIEQKGILKSNIDDNLKEC